MAIIDGNKAIQDILIRSLELDTYEYIMNQAYKANIARDNDFQKKFNHFYRIRRDSKWREKYYEIFENNKTNKDEVTFENILCNIYVFTDKTEASLASKMLATINPEKPIWDSRVLSFLNLKPKGKNVIELQDSMIEIYAQIEEWYRVYLATDEARENISLFDRLFPQYSWISDVKKIDYLIWGLKKQEIL